MPINDSSNGAVGIAPSPLLLIEAALGRSAALTSYEHLGVRLCSKSDEVLLAVLMCEHDIGLDPWLSFVLRLHPVSEPDPCMLVPRLVDYSMKGGWE